MSSTSTTASSLAKKPEARGGGSDSKNEAEAETSQTVIIVVCSVIIAAILVMAIIVLVMLRRRRRHKVVEDELVVRYDQAKPRHHRGWKRKKHDKVSKTRMSTTAHSVETTRDKVAGAESKPSPLQMGTSVASSTKPPSNEDLAISEHTHEVFTAHPPTLTPPSDPSVIKGKGFVPVVVPLQSPPKRAVVEKKRIAEVKYGGSNDKTRPPTMSTTVKVIDTTTAAAQTAKAPTIVKTMPPATIASTTAEVETKMSAPASTAGSTETEWSKKGQRTVTVSDLPETSATVAKPTKKNKQ